MNFVVLLLTCFVIADSQKYCPYYENIEPCSCSYEHEDKQTISCYSLKSSDQLVKVAANMKGLSISPFKLLQSNIGALPSKAFSGLEIDSIIIKKCNLTRLGEGKNLPPFLGLEKSLQSISITDSFVDLNRPLSSLSLSHLKKLNSLEFEGNFIPTIGNNWFDHGPYGLKVLAFYNSNTSVIGSHAFEALENLEQFSLTGSPITQLSRDMFPMPARNLERILLRDDKLHSLPSNFFSRMPALEQVYLENNFLTTLDEVIWAPVWSQLEFVYIHGNPIKCNSNLKWVYNYRLPEYYSGYCDSPDNLRYKDLRSITLSDLQ